jgi:hypothetical protein
MQDKSDKIETHILNSFEEVRDASLEVAAMAERSLTIMTPDLESSLYGSEDFLAVVKKLVLAKRHARVRVLVTEPSRTVRNGNHLVALGRRLNTYIDFRNLHEKYESETHPAFIIADDRAIIYRANSRRYDALFGLNDRALVRVHLDAFEQPWEDSVFKRNMRMAHI